VIGMAVRLPGANDLQALWDVLEKGRDMHTKVRRFLRVTLL
jgi:acyl transferase domain-containing protein